MHLCSQGRQSRGVRNTHYLFSGFVNGRQDFGDGPAEPALRWLPDYRGPRPFALTGGLGPNRGAHPCARPATLPFQNLVQCFLVWGQGLESAHPAAAIVSSPH